MPHPHPLARREGDPVPEVAFRMLRGGDWVTLTSEELFAGQRVVVFSLPGAFTPTCSSTHLPRYNELAPALREHGIARVVCIAVNDPFVMAEWGADQEAANVLLLPDGNGEFTRQMGLMVDKRDLNCGERSWRYAMLVRDKTIEKMFVEPDKPGDPFEVSDADTMFEYIAPGAARPDQVAVLSRAGCSFCARAKAMLAEAGIAFVDVPLAHSVRTQAVGAIAGARTVPQVFVNGRLIGGTEELKAFLAQRP